MSRKAQLLATLTETLYVEDVFSIDLYTGNGATQTVTNGLSIKEDGGLIWIKNRSQGDTHNWTDTVNGIENDLHSNRNQSLGIYGLTDGLTNDGFNVPNDFKYNTNGEDFVSWSFRIANSFFTIKKVNHTNGSNTTVNLGLLKTVGMVIFKRTDGDSDWLVWHRSLPDGELATFLNQTVDANNSIDVTGTTLTIDASVSTGAYVVYGFAHDVKRFGDNRGQSVVYCGKYTGNGSTNGPTISLGWEPAFIMFKAVGGASSGIWHMFDSTRGIKTDGVDQRLLPGLDNAEDSFQYIRFTSTGFKLETDSFNANSNGTEYIFIAIRKGPMK